MHESSLSKMRAFVDVHLAEMRGVPLRILDLGSQSVTDLHATYRPLFDDPAWRYEGLDIVPGTNVDIVLDDPYDWDAMEAGTYDLVITGQAFEHIEFFWVTMLELTRVLRPGGVAVVIAPSIGEEHRYPVDCWRFYRDGFTALARWAELDVLDSYTDWGNGEFADSILVARKPAWDDETRERFERRCDQLRSSVPPEGPPGRRPEAGSSPLVALAEGVLTPELERIGEAEIQAALAEADATRLIDGRPAFDAETEAWIEADLQRRLDSMGGLVGRYLRLRRFVADRAGEQGRALFHRVRHRA